VTLIRSSKMLYRIIAPVIGVALKATDRVRPPRYNDRCYLHGLFF
jgi:hypothetical protein